MAAHAWHEVLTWAAAGVVWMSGGVLIALSVWRRSRGTPATISTAPGTERRSPVDDGRRVAVALGVLVAALSFGAAAIHFAAAGDHVKELGLLGFGFYLAAAFQAAWAVAWLVGRTRAVAWIGIVGNAAISAAWLGSRTFGLPSGPTPWQPEAVGTPDAISTLFQVVIVALVVGWLTGAHTSLVRRVRAGTSAATIGIVPLVGVVFLVATLGVSVAVGGDHHDGQPDHSGAAHGVVPGVDAGAQGGHAAP